MPIRFTKNITQKNKEYNPQIISAHAPREKENQQRKGEELS